jgi:DNA-directed RNA polymerase delta subunit
MATNRFIDIIYDIAKHEYQYRRFTFANVWAKLKAKAKITKTEESKIIGEIFTDMLQDHRFLYCSNNYWRLKEFTKLEDQKDNKKALYDLNVIDKEDDDSIAKAVTEQIEEDDELLFRKNTGITEDFDDELPINNTPNKDDEDEENQ